MSKQIIFLLPMFCRLWLLSLFLAVSTCASAEEVVAGFSWQEIEPGYALGRYYLNSEQVLIPSEVLLLRFDPKRFQLKLVQAQDLSQDSFDVQTAAERSGAIAGINTNFFDREGGILGLYVSEGRESHRLQKGGSVLTGVFAMYGLKPEIVHRGVFRPAPSLQLAFQAGPRLIADGVALDVRAHDRATRRSGIAVSKTGEVILYATVLRFPGAKLQSIQKMLLELSVQSALNLDGGGSSQIFVKSNSVIPENLFISGGDLVPACLLVHRKDKSG